MSKMLAIFVLFAIVSHVVCKCDCDYHSGGCTISKAASPNTCCKCRYKGGWTCDGIEIGCLQSNSEYCKKPDKSRQACIECNGDCGGY